MYQINVLVERNCDNGVLATIFLFPLNLAVFHSIWVTLSRVATWLYIHNLLQYKDQVNPAYHELVKSMCWPAGNIVRELDGGSFFRMSIHRA